MSVSQDGPFPSEYSVDELRRQIESIKSGQVPRLVQEIEENGETVERTFVPLVVTRLGGTLPWNTNSTQLQCGTTVTDNSGDMNIRLVYECVCTHSQFKTLQEMRQEPAAVRLVSQSYTGKVTYDELKFDRVADSNGAVIAGDENTNEPIYTIQLQSKEDNESNGSE